MHIRCDTGGLKAALSTLRAALGVIPDNVWFTPTPEGLEGEPPGVLVYAETDGMSRRTLALRLPDAKPLEEVKDIRSYPVAYADLAKFSNHGETELLFLEPGALLRCGEEDEVTLTAEIKYRSPFPFPSVMDYTIAAGPKSDIENLEYFLAVFDVLGFSVHPRLRYFSGIFHVYAVERERLLMCDLCVEAATGGLWDVEVPVAVLEKLKGTDVSIKIGFERQGSVEITKGDQTYFARKDVNFQPTFDHVGLSRMICQQERCLRLEQGVRDKIMELDPQTPVLIKAEPGTTTVVPLEKTEEGYQVFDGVSQITCRYSGKTFASVIRATDLRAFSVETSVVLWGTQSPASPFLLANGRVFLSSQVQVDAQSLVGLLGDGMEVEKNTLANFGGDPADLSMEVFRGSAEDVTGTAHPATDKSDKTYGHARLYVVPLPNGRFKHAGGVSRNALSNCMREFGIQRSYAGGLIDRLYVEQVWPELEILACQDDSWLPWQQFRDPHEEERTDGAGRPLRQESAAKSPQRPARATAAPPALPAQPEESEPSQKIMVAKSLANPINSTGSDVETVVEAPAPPTAPVEEPVAYLLVDGCYVTRRDFHVKSLMEMRGPGGIRTGLIFSFLRELRKLIRIFNPARVIAVWDHASAAWRREILPGYRVRDDSKHAEDDLKAMHSQRDELRANLHLVGVRSIHLQGQEADDVIALIASSVQGRTIIASNDSDFEQLVDGRVEVYKIPKGVLLNRPVEPDELISFKAIVGDSTDKIPGIEGCGDKSMLKFIEELKAEGVPITFDEIKARAGKHNSWRIKRIVEPKKGEEGDPWEIVKRNRQLVDLRYGMRKIPSPIMVQALGLVQAPAQMSTIGFGEWVRKLGANSILTEMSDWQQSFGTLS